MSPAPADEFSSKVPGGSRVVTLRLPFSAASAAMVRRALQDWMRAYAVPAEVIEDARLVATELVGNAVRHAGPVERDQLLVSWREEGGHLAFAVTDGGGSTVPSQRVAPPQAPGGRGLNIVDALAQRWWVEQGRDSTTVHAVLPLRALASAS